jgi:type 2 lantibiotic biosynthesis protein LanM
MTAHQSRFLETADRIGSRLCRDAIWADRHCNWLGGSLDSATGSPVYRVLGPSVRNPLAGVCLYEGTAGIALFLAQLFSFTRDSIHKCTLEGALNQILRQLRSRGEFTDVGFFTGLTGIAYALIEAGQIIEHDDLVQRGIGELVRLQQISPTPRSVDVLGGSAGVIPVLIDSAARFGRPELLATAVRHGEHLIASADRSDDGWSWPTNARWARNLTGYAHGVAGIAWSLLELHAATGDERFRTAASEALRYERRHFDAERRDWLDFRKLEETGTWHEPRCATAWCHGAPGIGMSRLRVRDLVPNDDAVPAEIEDAIKTTLASLVVPNNFSLCHGHAGNSELMILAAEQLGRPELRDAAESVGQIGIERFADTGSPWPCGVGTPWECPTLMLGLAGIGHFFLRLADSAAVRSVLIHTPRGK